MVHVKSIEEIVAYTTSFIVVKIYWSQDHNIDMLIK